MQGQRKQKNAPDYLLGLNAEGTAAVRREDAWDFLEQERDAWLAYETPTGDIAVCRRASGIWTESESLTAGDVRREGERWIRPRLALGTDGRLRLYYYGTERRRLFSRRFQGGVWGPREAGPAYHHIKTDGQGRWEEERAPLTDYDVAYSEERTVSIRLQPAGTGLPAREVRLCDGLSPSAPQTLFLDPAAAEVAHGVIRTVERPVKHPDNPVFPASDNPDAPDATRVLGHGTVLFEDGRYRMWYAAVGRVDRFPEGESGVPWQALMNCCYAESDDGLRWEKPVLNQVPYRGSRRNNILRGLNVLPILLRDDADPDPARRYKCIEQADDSQREEPEIGHLHTSADGLRWNTELAPRHFPGTRPWWGESISFFRDDADPDPARRYKAYGYLGSGPARRTAAFRASPDAVHWTGYPEDPVIDPRQVSASCIHDLVVWREAGLYIGLLQTGDALHVYDWTLVFSRDGTHFHVVDDGRPFLGRGGEQDWDKGGMQVCAPVRAGDEWRFYYGALERPWSAYPAPPGEIWGLRMHGGLASIGVGRYACFMPRQPGEDGRVGTPAFQANGLAGRRLVVNADLREGDLQAVLAPADRGKNLPKNAFDDALPITGNGTALYVQGLEERVPQAADEPVRLVFRLRGKARLYGYAWQSA